VFLLVALAFVGANRRWFQRDPEFRSEFLSAEGLRSGLELELRGFAIGRVKSLRLTDDLRVEVVLSVYREYATSVLAGSVVELQVQPLGFGSRLLLFPGRRGGAPLAPGSLIPSTDLEEGQTRLARGEAARTDRRDEVATLLATLPPLVTQVQGTIETLTRTMARLDTALLGDPAAADGGLLGQAETTVAGLDSTLRVVRTTAADLAPALANLTAFSDRLAHPEGLLPTLVGPDGSAGRFFRDDARLYGQLDSALVELNGGLNQLRQILSALNASTPEMVVLMDEATGALTEGQKVMEGLRNNPFLRGGISPEVPPPGTFEGYREDVR
jgi:phospholipid/cholesterol/gamma-HCH transport system substrate-binding protein